MKKHLFPINTNDLFAVAVALLIYCAVKRRPYKLLIAIFAVAIVMIGFPSLKPLFADFS